MSENPRRTNWRAKSVVECVAILSEMLDRDDERIDAAGESNEEREDPARLTAGRATKSHHGFARLAARIAALEGAQIRAEEALARLTATQADTDQRLNELTKSPGASGP